MKLLQENETAIEFAQRVKHNICLRGGLVDLPWYVTVIKLHLIVYSFIVLLDCTTVVN